MKYRSAEAFKSALLDKLKKESERRGIPFVRIQMRFLFERLLARAQCAFPQLIVKGGAAMEFRLPQARTTRDLDVGVCGVDCDQVLPRLQQSGQGDFGDYLTFEMEYDPNHSLLEAEGMKYTGRRMRVRARLAGKPLFGYFGVDVSLGEPAEAPEVLIIPSLLDSAGLAPLQISIYSLESHIAEKLHAYTLPRSHPNSRVKDLPDIALLATHRSILAKQLRQALEKTFGHRKTHELPLFVPPSPTTWIGPYATMATENGLRWTDLASLEEVVGSFLDPILDSSNSRIWSPVNWKWEK